VSATQPRPVQSITLGAVGQPGARVFYLQIVGSSGSRISLVLEKTQALILADQIDGLLDELQRQYPTLAAPAPIAAPALQVPDSTLFRAGKFGLQYNPEADWVAFQVTELRGLDQGTPDSLDVWVTRAQLRSLSDTAQRVAEQGAASTN